MILSRYADSYVTINNDYYVPYLAGSSIDRKTVYIDKRLERLTITRDGRVRDNFKYIATHEVAEAYGEDIQHYKYQYAHEFYGTAEERRAIEADGFDWDEYQGWALSMVKKFKKIPKGGEIPVELDLKPEKDTHDYYEYDKFEHMQKEEKRYV